MSNDFFRVNKGVKLNPTDEPALTEQGQLYLDNNDNATALVGVIKAIDPNITTNAIQFDGASSEIAITSATYGTVTVTPDNQVGIVANNTVKLPVSNTASVDVLVARDTADTLTNKTINTNDNTIEIASTQITATTGTGGVVVLDTSPTINSPSLVTPTLGDATVTSITGSATADLVINSDPAYELEMQGNNVLVKTFNNALAVATGFINIKTGDQTGTSNSGNVDINTGDSDANTSGNINIITGDTTASPSGDINISSGMSVSSFRGAVNLDGSAVNITPNTLNFGPYSPLAAAYPLTITSNPDVYFSLSDSFGMGADAFEVTSLNQVEITAASGDASLKAESGDVYIKGTNAYIGPIVNPPGQYALKVSDSLSGVTLTSGSSILIIESMLMVQPPGYTYAGLSLDAWSLELGWNPSGGSKELQFSTNSGSNYLRLKAADLPVNSYTLTFPGTAPTAYQVLQYDGADYQWSKTFDTIYGASGTPFTINPDAAQDLYLNLGGTSKLTIGDTTGLNYINIDTNNPTIQTITSPSNFKIESNNAGTPGIITLDAQEVLYKENGTTYVSINTGGIESLENLDGSSKYFLFQANSNVVTLKANNTLAATYDLIFPDNAPTSEYVLGYNGTNLDWYKFRPAVSTNSSITASGTVTINTSELDLNQIIVVSGASGAVTLSTTPFGSVAPVGNGTIIRLIGESDTNTVTIISSDIAKGAVINGSATLGLYNSITLQYISSLDRYIEISRNF